MGCLSKGVSKDLTPEAKNWNDMSPCEQKCKRGATISLVALALIIAAGTAVAIYFCCTTTNTFTNSAGKVIVQSNAPLAALPGVFGGAALIAAVAGAICTHIFWGMNCDNKIDDELRIELKGANTLELVYQRFYKKIRPLVIQKILTIEEARELRSILEGYHQILDVKEKYDKLGGTDKNDVDTNPTHYPQFTQMNESLTSLRQRWQKLHQNKFPPTSKD